MNDYKLLEQLYCLHSPSRQEKKMARLLTRLCQQRGANVTTDKHGNVFVTKGQADTYPCICAHMDQVQHQHSKDFHVMREGDIIYAFSAKAKGQQGLGADDKNGLWIALELLRELKVLKCAFFVSEEIGCIGSSNCDLSFFKDVRFCVQPDRRNGHDLITSISGKLCSEDFLKAIGYQKYGYKPTTGLTTDVGTLASRGIGVSCVNISCGYYEPHTDHEVTSWKELCNAKRFAKHICSLKQTFPFSYKEDVRQFFGGYNGYGYQGHWGYYGGYRDYDDFCDNYDSRDRHPRQYGRADIKPQQTQQPTIPQPVTQTGSKPVKLFDEKQLEYGDDILTMEAILQYDPSTTFEEILRFYLYQFDNQDADILRGIYKDVHEQVCKEYEKRDAKTVPVAQKIQEILPQANTAEKKLEVCIV